MILLGDLFSEDPLGLPFSVLLCGFSHFFWCFLINFILLLLFHPFPPGAEEKQQQRRRGIRVTAAVPQSAVQYHPIPGSTGLSQARFSLLEEERQCLKRQCLKRQCLSQERSGW